MCSMAVFLRKSAVNAVSGQVFDRTSDQHWGDMHERITEKMQ